MINVILSQEASLWTAKPPERRVRGQVGSADMTSDLDVRDAVGVVNVKHRPLNHLVMKRNKYTAVLKINSNIMYK